MTSLFEMGGIGLPRPMGHNFLWHVAKCEPERPSGDIFKTDYRLLQCIPMATCSMVAAGVASLISLAISSILNKFNLTERELNTYRSRNHVNRPAHTFLSQLFSFPPDDEFHSICLFSTACAIVTQYTPCSINARCIATPEWFCNNRHAGNQGPRNLWQTVYNLHIPYLGLYRMARRLGLHRTCRRL